MRGNCWERMSTLECEKRRPDLACHCLGGRNPGNGRLGRRLWLGQSPGLQHQLSELTKAEKEQKLLKVIPEYSEIRINSWEEPTNTTN